MSSSHAQVGRTSNKLDDTTHKIRIEGVHCKLKESMKLAEDGCTSTELRLDPNKGHK
jgi:hypothetical protein